MEYTLDLILLGKRLRNRRKAMKLTMKVFSERCDISERYLANIERGQQAPKLETFVRIANAAGVTPDYLLQDSIAMLQEKGNPEIHDLLKTFSPEQQKIVCEFVRDLGKSMK